MCIYKRTRGAGRGLYKRTHPPPETKPRALQSRPAAEREAAVDAAERPRKRGGHGAPQRGGGANGSARGLDEGGGFQRLRQGASTEPRFGRRTSAQTEHNAREEHGLRAERRPPKEEQPTARRAAQRPPPARSAPKRAASRATKGSGATAQPCKHQHKNRRKSHSYTIAPSGASLHILYIHSPFASYLVL